MFSPKPAMIPTQLMDKVIAKWADLPDDATEAVVSHHFIPPLLEALGFDSSGYRPQFPTGNGAQKVDFAARKNIFKQIPFGNDPQNPDLFIELKGRKTDAGQVINLAEGTPVYKKKIGRAHV